MAEKNVLTSGADEQTPSHPQYFSWINNTNEGSTEAQTLVNIDFFRYMRDRYGMQLEIYAWDAGNLDGASETYAALNGEKLKKQFPNGYGPCVRAAADAGFRLGVWGGADGYGNTPEEEAARRELIVSLCRDYHFALFKFDSVCGGLRPEKRAAFAETMRECRKYSPDLVLLNHRNNLGEADIYSTTFLWGSTETYVDVLITNPITAMHHRAFLFKRGHVPGLSRMTEDHGVCISSCIDYFEDDMIYQAFGRSLILAPEIYGNPWLMRDDELPILADIYNLHRRWRDILVSGIALPDFAGASAVSRGDEHRRFLTLGNAGWEKELYPLTLDKSIGLEPCDRVAVFLRHPFNEAIGEFAYGDTVHIPLMPFRACLIEVCDSALCDKREPASGEYRVLSYRNGLPAQILLLKADGEVRDHNGQLLYDGPAFDCTEPPPEYLANAIETPVPADAEALYEATCFSLDNDSLEKRSLRRSGKTKIPEVQAARDAFFGQKTYVLRGCDSEFLFDGNPDTFYDGCSKYYTGGFRLDGGCLRVDLGRAIEADKIEITYYATTEASTIQIPEQKASPLGEVSGDLINWTPAPLSEDRTVGPYTMPYVRHRVHNIELDHGERKTAVYTVTANGSIRYFRLALPMDRLFSFRVYKDGRDVTPETAKAGNLMAAYNKKAPISAKRAVVTAPAVGKLAVAISGKHGREGVYCGAKIKGEFLGFADRAPSYPSNVWEHLVCSSDHDYTYYLDIPEFLVGREIEIYALFNQEEGKNCDVKVYWCPNHVDRGGVELDLSE